jgi:HPt (histidine-containing phosphotransfer) domain-containing protein
VTKFLQTSTRTIDLMRRASDDRDFDALRRLGHSLKSAAAAVGAIRMGRLCANLEELLQYGIASDVDQVVNDIASRYEKVRTAFGESDPSGASS